MNHTPGPWKLVDDGTVRSKAFGKSDMMGDYLGVIVCDLKAGTGSPVWPSVARAHSQPEAEANARLIAAAPDLLEALEELYKAGPDCEGGPLGEAYRKARAAIAKAEKP